MKKYTLPFIGIIMLLVVNSSMLKAQNSNGVIQSTSFKNSTPVKVDDMLKGAVEDVSQRTPYSSVYKTSNGKIIAHYSSQVINPVDANGNQYPHSLITGPTSDWNGGSTPSCLYPNFYSDSILITVPAGINITFFTVDYAYVTNAGANQTPLTDGIFYLSTPCGKTDTIGCLHSDTAGVCYLMPGQDFSSLLTTCISPSCTQAQSFWLDAHLSRLHGGVGCDTNYVWYSAYADIGSKYVFSAYVEGTPVISLSQISTSDKDSCYGTTKVTPSGGMPPYTYLWSPNNQTTDSIGSLCAGSYCCSVTDSKGCTDSICVTISNTSGINTIHAASSITIYPDPNNGNFVIAEITQGQLIELYDYSGQKLNSIEANNTTMHVDISDKAKGIYLIRIINKNGSLAAEKKIVKIQ